MHLDVVVARYNEDISWLSNVVPRPYRVFVYDKGGQHPLPEHHISLSNVGREAETYLQHNVRNYDCLGDYTAFFQGNPHDHLKGIYISSINFCQFEGIDFANIIGKHCLKTEYYFKDPNKSPYGLPVCQKALQYFDITEPNEPMRVELSRGAQFVCSRECIQRRPKRWYEYIVKQLHALNAPIANTWIGLYTTHQNTVADCIDPWTMERLWPMIFGDYSILMP